MAGHDGLGHAELIHAALDGLQGLVHGALAVVDRDVRLHLKGVGPGPVRRAVVRQLDRGGGRAERGLLVARHAGDRERGRRGGRHGDAGHAGRAHRLAQLVGRALGQQPQGLVGLDAEHQVDAALQVEPEPHLLVRGEERKHRQRDDADDDEHTGLDVLGHGCRNDAVRRTGQPPAAAPGSRQWLSGRRQCGRWGRSPA